MSKNKKSKRLLLISGLILLISTVLLGILTPIKNSNIFKTQEQINNISEVMSYYEFNIDHQSNQLVKLSSTKGTYTILKELNSPEVKEYEERVKAQYIQAIIMLDRKNFKKNELAKLSFEQLDEIGKGVAKEYTKKANKLKEEKEILETQLSRQIKSRNNWTIAIVIIQVIGLSIGLVAEIFRT